MEAAALVVLAALAAKLLDFAKFLRAKDWNAAFTQLSAWAVGIFIMFVGGASSAFKEVQIPTIGTTLGNLDGASKFLLGLVMTSLLSLGYDLKKAIDTSDSAKTPHLLN